jgi:hypothetical protein
MRFVTGGVWRFRVKVLFSENVHALSVVCKSCRKACETTDFADFHRFFWGRFQSVKICVICGYGFSTTDLANLPLVVLL